MSGVAPSPSLPLHRATVLRSLDNEQNTISIDREFIRRTLDLYKPEDIAVEAAQWSCGTIDVSIRQLPYPFTKPGHIEYMTASMAMLYISQVSYINARMLISHHGLPPSILVTQDDFFSARDKGNLVFLKVDIRFKRKLWISDVVVPIGQTMYNAHVVGSNIAMGFECSIAEGACRARGVFAMALD